MNFFISLAFENPQLFFLILIAVVFSICFHEFMHAWIALQFGDSTAADRGHLTLNPLRQMGWISILMLLFIGIAWGAVPVDAAKLRSKGRWALPLVSLSGPAANLFLFVVAWFAFGWLQPRIPSIIEDPEAGGRLLIFVVYLGVVNGTLCIFNLFPIPGLDGWDVFHELFPRLSNLSSETAKGIMLFTILLAFLGVGRLFGVFEHVMLMAPDILGGRL